MQRDDIGERRNDWRRWLASYGLSLIVHAVAIIVLALVLLHVELPGSVESSAVGDFVRLERAPAPQPVPSVVPRPPVVQPHATAPPRA
ncbi:MAG: hypothetical protein WCE44_08030, partial [Candidatus Velthaea sp.]